jgi:hypothetical protein
MIPRALTRAIVIGCQGKRCRLLSDKEFLSDVVCKKAIVCEKAKANLVGYSILT